jgi:hypothetical protein
MSETSKSPLQTVRQEAAIAAAQNGAAGWSRAISRLSEGLMAAAKAAAEDLADGPNLKNDDAAPSATEVENTKAAAPAEKKTIAA